MTTEERFEKIEAGIRDLIVVSRTVLNSIELLGGTVDGLRGSMEELREEFRQAQKRTDEKLNALVQAQMETEQKVARLVEAVDRLVRFRGPNGQGGESSR